MKKGKIIASCGCEVKRVMWNIVISDYTRTGNSCLSYLCVCAKCYHNFYKRVEEVKKTKNYGIV